MQTFSKMSIRASWVTAIGLIMVLAFASAPASAATYEYGAYTGNGHPDVGGRDAFAYVTVNGQHQWCCYNAQFHAYGEVLELSDHWTDGSPAVVHVRYYGPGRATNPYQWTYDTGWERTVQLGSDDDLAEGYRIQIRLCVGHTSRCTPWGTGTT